jgi:hypothetical protein
MYRVDWFGTIKFEGCDGRRWSLRHPLAAAVTRLNLVNNKGTAVRLPKAALRFLELLVCEAVESIDYNRKPEGVSTIRLHDVVWDLADRRAKPRLEDSLKDGAYEEIAGRIYRAVADLGTVVGKQTVENVGKAYKFAGKIIATEFEKRPEQPTLFTWDFFPKPADATDLIQLLDPRFRAVEFVGLVEEAEVLWKWLTEETKGPRLSVKVVGGESGIGKTRLAYRLLELIQQRMPRKWHAGLPFGSLQELFANNTFCERCKRQPTLIVIDDAALHVEQIVKVITETYDRHEPGPRLCFLLLERVADDSNGWLRKLRDALLARTVQMLSEPTLVLTHPEFSHRRELFSNALTAAAKLLKHQPLTPTADIEEFLATPAVANPLSILLAAISSQEKQGFTPVRSPSSDLAVAMAARESSRIRTLAASSNCSDRFLLHMAAFATLTRGLKREELVAACDQESAELEPTPQWSSIDFALLIEDSVLPSFGGQSAAPLLPEIVGCAFIQSVLQHYDEPSGPIVSALRFKPSETAFTLTRSLIPWAVSALDEIRFYPDTRPLTRLRRLAQRDIALRAELAHNLYVRGVIFSENGQPERAQNYSDDAWQIFESLPDIQSVGLYFFSYAELLLNRALLAAEQRDQAAEGTFLDKALALYSHGAEKFDSGPPHGTWKSREEIPSYRKRHPRTLDPELFSSGLAGVRTALAAWHRRYGDQHQALAVATAAIQEIRSTLHAPTWRSLELLARSLMIQGDLEYELGLQSKAQQSLFESAAWFFELGRVDPRRFFDEWRTIQLNLKAIEPAYPRQIRITSEAVNSIYQELGRIRSELLALDPAEIRTQLNGGELYEPGGLSHPLLLLTDPADGGYYVLHKTTVDLGGGHGILQVLAVKCLRSETSQRGVDNTRFGAGPVEPIASSSPIFYKPWFCIWIEKLREFPAADFHKLLLLLDISISHVRRLATQNVDLFLGADSHWTMQMAEATAGLNQDFLPFNWLIDAARLHVHFFDHNRGSTSKPSFATFSALPFLKMGLELISQRLNEAVAGFQTGAETGQHGETFAALIRMQAEIRRVIIP